MYSLELLNLLSLEKKSLFFSFTHSSNNLGAMSLF